MSVSIPTVSIEDLTPAKAEQFLTKNVKNRNKKGGKIEKYARDMAAGNWRLTGEAIKFDHDGNLTDGQNRCYAVILSGATIQTMVIRGLDPDAMTVMDSGTPRSPGDSLNLAGYTNGKDLAAVANVHKAWTEGYFRHCMTARPTNVAVTNAEAVDYVKANPSLESAMQFTVPVKASLPLPIGSLATAFIEFCEIDPDQAVEFFDRIRDFKTDGAGDPVATLLKRVASDKQKARAILPSTGLFYLIRAWNAFRANEQLTKFQIGSVERGWAPIPEPK